LFTFIVLCLFTWGSGNFVYYEYVDEAIAFGDVPAWMLEVIMPVGGGVMAVRYLLLAIKP
jgi:TRAP-type C4-dicarboxylate transport system permease small subunit